MRLTKRTIDSAKYVGDGKSRHVLWDSETRGFGLRVYPSNEKSFVVSYRNGDGKKRLKVLGPYGVLTLVEARKKARKVLAGVLDGDDPLSSRAVPESDNMDTAVKAFLAVYQHDVRAVSYMEMERIMNTHVLPPWKSRAVSSIGPDDIAKIVNTLRAAGKPVMARQLFRALTRFFKWAKTNSYRSDLPFDSDTAGQLIPARIYKKRNRVLTPTEIRLLWQAADHVGYPIGPFAKMILVSAQRPGTNTSAPLGEVGKMRRGDLDLERRAWSLPREATKSDRAHEVPLPTLAVEILEQMPRMDPTWLFSTTRGKAMTSFHDGKKRLNRAIENMRPEGIPPWTFHDLRRTASTFMRRDLALGRDLIDEIQNHSLGAMSETYAPERSLPAMRRGLESWARLLRLIIDEDAWTKADAVLNGDDFELADEFRRAIQSDAETWNHYRDRLVSGRLDNVVELVPAAH